MATNILFLSRHECTEEQKEALASAFNTTVNVVQLSRTVSNGKEVAALMKEHNCSEVVAVLPINILGQLLREGVKPLRAVMDRVLDGEKAVFNFVKFERVLKVEIVTEDL